MAGQHQVDTPHDAANDRGTLILVVRRDDDAEPATEDGNLAPLTVTADGYLRVAAPAAGVAVEKAPTVESLIEEQNSLLRRVVLGLEILTGKSIPDPR